MFDRDSGPISRAGVQLNLTAAGWAVVATVVAAAFLSASRSLAVGFFIPILVAVIIDVYLSWHVASRRSVSIVASRTVMHTPGGIPLRVKVDGPAHPVRVTVAFPGGDDQSIGVSEGVEVLDLKANHTYATDYLRSDMTCTVFGLGRARRWETHRVPTLHWAPAPGTTRITTPSAVDEIARLRTYVPGDRMSRVSWPVTARTGRMHVRAAGDGHEEFTVILNLGLTTGARGEGAPLNDPAETDPIRHALAVLEGSLQLASTLVSQLLEDGHQVRLVTTELVPEVRERLCAAAINDPRHAAPVPEGTPTEMCVVDRYVTDEDDAAQRLALAEPGPEVAWSYGSYVEVSMLGIRTLP